MSPNKLKLVLILALAATAISLGAGLVFAKVTITDFAGTAWLIAPPSGGDLNCIGGSPTGAWPPCTAGAKAQLRGMVLTYRQEARKADGSPEPMLTGIRTIVFNYTGQTSDGKNHTWGTWRVVLDGGRGEWEGTFTGFGGDRPIQGQIVGHGTDGEVEGMQLRSVYSYEVFPGLETLSGFILDPEGGR